MPSSVPGPTLTCPLAGSSCFSSISRNCSTRVSKPQAGEVSQATTTQPSAAVVQRGWKLSGCRDDSWAGSWSVPPAQIAP